MTFKYHSVIACTCVISSCRLVTRSEYVGNVTQIEAVFFKTTIL